MAYRGNNLPPKPRGGARPGAGRPKGSKNKLGKNSVEKLAALEFDPIEEMVKKYHEISALLASGEIKIGSVAHAQLTATQGSLINNLMAYGYRKVPEKQEIDFRAKKPVAIRLADDDD